MATVSPDLLKNEYWRLNNLYYIKDKQGKKVLFKMNWAQKLLYQTMWFLNIILKARQLGMTTFIQIFMLDRCLFNDNTNAGVIAHNLNDAKSFFQDKIKFAYDNLPEDLKYKLEARTDSADELQFSNGSRIRVGTSLRSGTLQYLHISEFGKLCAKHPERAREVISGALNTVAPGQFVFIESTAEGAYGAFYTMCQAAIKLQSAVEKGLEILTKMDYKFFFYPWYEHPDYHLNEPVHIPKELQEYFQELEEEEGVVLTKAQKAWYVKKAQEQGDNMKQEYPATPQEAFEKLLIGSIFAVQITKARKEDRMTSLPIARGVPVNTFWDLGRNDTNAIWFHQRVGAWDNFIYYYENRLQDLTFYIEELQRLKMEFGWNYGGHYLPHDVEVTDISAKDSRKDILKSNGLKPLIVVPRCKSKNESIDQARRAFYRSRFDIKRCEQGIRHLENYRWKWDDKQGVFVQTPVHDEASNGSDAFQQFGMGYKGEHTSIQEQFSQINGTGGRRYAQDQRARNPLATQSYKHIT